MRRERAPRILRSANDEFQMLSSLLTNRTKRHRAGRFLVQGVRPVSLAISQGWSVEALLCDGQRSLSTWARGVLDQCPLATRYHLAPELMAQLSERDEPAELIALVGIRMLSLTDLYGRDPRLVVALDRPGSPGNLGSILRSCDALGADGVVVIGHACDPFDPQSVRASTGSIFSVPICVVPSFQQLREHHPPAGPRALVAADEQGEALPGLTLTGPTTLLFGNETRGLSAATLSACDRVVAIPMRGTASSLNLASAVSIFLYQAAAV